MSIKISISDIEQQTDSDKMSEQEQKFPKNIVGKDYSEDDRVLTKSINP